MNIQRFLCHENNCLEKLKTCLKRALSALKTVHRGLLFNLDLKENIFLII